jgi:aryl-alcohol dehydrogenase-like predicted oxidoreductase
VRYRPLGATGIVVSEIGFGTWAIGGDRHGMVAYGPTDDEESLRALAAAHALGCTFFDTSNLYGWGHAEELLGRAFASRRDGVVIATKAGYADAAGRQDFSASGVTRSIEGSLRRLQTDYVDLLQLHNPEPADLDGNEALFAELESMRAKGMVRAVGISARTPDEALLFVTRHRPATLQVNFNLADLRALRNGLFDTCVLQGIGVIVRTPLASGFLTGRVGQAETLGPGDHRQRFDDAARSRWSDCLRQLSPVFADAPEATPAQNAIRFCLSFEAVSSVIPGMMRTSEVTEDLGAGLLPGLDADQLRAVQAVYDRSSSER